MACALNYDAIVTKLLVLGASTTVQDNMGMTPVMTACSYGHQQAMEALASKGIDASSKRIAGTFLIIIEAPEIGAPLPN